MKNDMLIRNFGFEAINKLTNFQNARIVLYLNGNLSHINIKNIFTETNEKIEFLKQRIAKLESQINEKKN